LSRRQFLKATIGPGAACVGVGFAAPRPAHAQAATGKVRLAYLQLGWAASEIIHKEDLLGKRGWQPEYSVVPGSPVPLLNQLITDQVVLRGQGVYLAKQIDLWRKATGRPSGFPVHVCYLVHNEFMARNASIARDLKDAQKDAVDIWYTKPERAMEIVAEVTKLPPDVIKVAHRETVKMLSGLPDEQVETLIAQLQINKEYGFLKSDVWDNPDRIRKEFFHRA